MKQLLADIGSAGTEDFEELGLDEWYQNADTSTILKEFYVESIAGILLPFALIKSYGIIGPAKVFKERVSKVLKK